MYQPLSTYPPEVEFYKNYFATSPDECPSYFYSTTREHETDVYVIAFNNLFLAQYQIRTLRKFFQSPFNLILVDNNNWLHADESRSLLQLCIDERVTYLKAPDNYYQRPEHFDPTMKLGTTMNWLYVNCVQARRPKYFGFLDQDCFLVRDLDLRPWLDVWGMYGKVVRSQIDEAWTLHVTVNFYRLDFLGLRLLDFRASYPHQLDTGGANYDILYKDFRPEDYEIEHHSVRFAEQDVNRKDSVQHYEIIEGGWYHMCASSHDQLAGDGLYKLAYTKGYLDARLQEL
jgi:hypothetical protein